MKRSQVFLIVGLIVVLVASVAMGGYLLQRARLDEAREYSVLFAAELDADREAYEEDSVALYERIRGTIGWEPSLFTDEYQFGFGIEPDGEVRVSFTVGDESHAYSDRTGWTVGRASVPVPVER